MRSDAHALYRPLARFNALTFAIVFGVLLALLLFGSTMFLVVKGGPTPGARLSLLAQYLPGYSVSFFGACVGAIWALGLGAFLSYFPAYIYYRGVLRSVRASNGEANDAAILHRTARVHVPSFAASFGAFAGSVLFVATLWLVLKHEPGESLGPHLGLLMHYLPGYDVSIGGAFLGLAYLFVVGAAAFALVGLIYNRLVRMRPGSRMGS